MQIYTSRYANRSIEKYHLSVYGISLYHVRHKTAFKIEGYLKELAPTRDMFGLPYNIYRPKYLAILNKLGVDRIRELLLSVTDGKDVVLLCFEDLRKPDKWCHRRIFAEWWQEQTGEKVKELQEYE